VIDVLAIDVKYMSSDDFVTKEDNDITGLLLLQQITKYYRIKVFNRVLDLRGGISGAFNSGALTAYFHKSIGGLPSGKALAFTRIL
jgi:hypothetical protein